MWLCAARRDHLTSSGPISFKSSISCYGRSEKPEESLSSKYFCIIVLLDSDPKQLASTSERSDSIYCVASARSEVQVIFHIWKLLYVTLSVKTQLKSFFETYYFLQNIILGVVKNILWK